MHALRRILADCGLEQYVSVFEENRVDLDVLPALTAEDLKEMQIPIGDRRRILRLAEVLRASETAEAQTTRGPPGVPAAGFKLRQISAVFVDLVGSTSLAEQLDVEDYRAVLASFHECCTHAVKRHGGTPERYIGDALLACFGYPQAAEDDGLRAGLAAIDIAKEVRELHSPTGAALDVRIGIATGVAMTADLMSEGVDSVGPATGAVLNLAARLQELAVPGSILIDNQTRQLLDRRFRVSFFGTHRLKGFADPKTVWQILDMRLGGEGESDWQQLTPFSGRHDELAMLSQRWGDVRRGGSVVLIEGEAGIGKSRLVSEFIARLELPEAQVLRMECSASDRLRPLFPLRRMIEVHAGLSTMREQAARLARLRAWVEGDLRISPRGADALARLLSIPPDSTEPDEESPRERKEFLFETLVQLLERAVIERPAFCLFEDLHWADPTTEEFLEYVAAAVAPLGMLVVCTYRREFRPSIVGERRVSLISLSRLDERHAAEVVRSIVGAGGLAPDIADAIIARTDGVPLFIEELTKSVLESRSGGRSDARAGHALPTTLLGSLLARLDRVPGAHKVAPVGAAIGRSFPHELLICVTGLAETEAARILSGLVSTGLLMQHGHGPEAIYVFKHVLVQDAAYETLPKSRRISIHLRIAEALEAQDPAIVETHPEVLARHLSAAGRHEAACLLWRRAAVAAQGAFANKEAVGFIRAALDANGRLPDGPARRASELELRQMLYVPLEITRWGSTEIAENLERMRELHEKFGEEEMPLGILHGIANYHVIAGNVGLARSFTDRVISRYGAEDPVAMALGLRSRGFCNFLAGNLDDAIRDFREVIRLCVAIEPARIKSYYHADSALVSQCMTCWALALKGAKDELEKEIADADARISEIEAPWERIYSLHLLASACQSSGDAASCVGRLSIALPMAEEAGSDYWMGWGTVLRGWAKAVTTRDPLAPGEIEAGIAQYVSTGSKQMVPYAKTLLAEAHLATGDNAEARTLLEELAYRRAPPEIRYIDFLIARLPSFETN